MHPLVAWARERENIRIKKERGDPPPWTTDPVLARYRFTNLRRRDDRVSRWLLENVLLEKHMDYDIDTFLLFSALCRWINWPPTIKVLIERGYWPNRKLDLPAIGRAIDKRVRSGEKTWTGAYMVRAKPGSKKGKGHFVAVEVIAKPLRPKLELLKQTFAERSRRAVWAQLYSCMNWGPFMAGQVSDDWSWTPLLAKADDLKTWAPQGPGSLRGFNRLLGLPLKTAHPDDEWCTQLQLWRAEIVVALGSDYNNLDMQSVQSALCEVDKWLRVKGNEGRPRANYTPETAY